MPMWLAIFLFSRCEIYLETPWCQNKASQLTFYIIRSEVQAAFQVSWWRVSHAGITAQRHSCYCPSMSREHYFLELQIQTILRLFLEKSVQINHLPSQGTLPKCSSFSFIYYFKQYYCTLVSTNFKLTDEHWSVIFPQLQQDLIFTTV